MAKEQSKDAKRLDYCYRIEVEYGASDDVGQLAVHSIDCDGYASELFNRRDEMRWWCDDGREGRVGKVVGYEVVATNPDRIELRKLRDKTMEVDKLQKEVRSLKAELEEVKDRALRRVSVVLAELGRAPMVRTSKVRKGLESVKSKIRSLD